MDKFTVLNGVVAPLDRANVDTDQIIPKQYLASIKRTGFAEGLFADWRKNPDFVLNQPRYKGASILLGRKISIGPITAAEVPERFGFVPRPVPAPGGYAR